RCQLIGRDRRGCMAAGTGRKGNQNPNQRKGKARVEKARSQEWLCDVRTLREEAREASHELAWFSGRGSVRIAKHLNPFVQRRISQVRRSRAVRVRCVVLAALLQG